MKIGILGTGHIGKTLALKLPAAGTGAGSFRRSERNGALGHRGDRSSYQFGVEDRW